MSTNEPETHADRSDTPAPEAGDRPVEDPNADDVEGHWHLAHPDVSRQAAADRAREVERHVRDQQKVREARSKDRSR